MAVVVDAMGGDFAPDEIVAGVCEAVAEWGLEVFLVGDEARLRAYSLPSGVEIVHAPQVVGMNEHAARALRRMPDNSISVGIRLLKEGKAKSFVSAGHTGAVMGAAFLELGVLPGVERPAIATIIPGGDGGYRVVLDVGANADCRPSHLVDFAVMGAAYSRVILGVDEPRVGLLNIGEEPRKGSEFARRAHEALERAEVIDFIGNVEPAAVFEGVCDVAVTEGFVGNIFLKTIECVTDIFHGLLEKLPASALKGLKGELGRFSRLNPQYAGAPLLGVDGCCIITHGGTRAPTMKYAVKMAHSFGESDILSCIAGGFGGRRDASGAEEES